MIKEQTKFEPLDKVSTGDPTVALCAKVESEAEIEQYTATGRVEKVKSETIDTLAYEVLFGVPPIEVAFTAKPMYKVRMGIGVT